MVSISSMLAEVRRLKCAEQSLIKNSDFERNHLKKKIMNIN